MNVVKLTTEQQATLTRLAAQTGKSPSEGLQMALATLEKHEESGNGTPTETVHAAMTRLGLLGCVSDAPADLSTNPSYMEGFGSNGR
jgi:hypothetical protein